MTEEKQRLERVMSSFEAQPFMQLIKASISFLYPGKCHITVAYDSSLTQQHGLFHGGLMATLADNAAGFAACSLMEISSEPLSVEFKINFIAKATGTKLVAKSEVIKNGRTLKVCQTNIFCLTDREETLCATSLATIMAVKPF